MARDTLEVLNGSGHLSLSWDPENEREVAEARAEVERLKAAGYSFFLVNDGPADEVAAGHGALDVVRIEDPILTLSVHENTPPIMEAAAETVVAHDPEPEGDHRSGEYRAWKRRQGQRAAGQPVTAPGRRAVAMAPMRGGA